MLLDTIFSVNSVIWISSIPEDEVGIVGRMVESMETISKESGFGFQHVLVNNANQLLALIDELSLHAKDRKMRPLLHFDMHGNEDEGLHISASDEFVSWPLLAEHLRKLNISTKNNLCVVGATCFGLRAITPISISSATPFYILLAPEHTVNLGFLEKNIPAFYRDLFDPDGLEAAYSKNLAGEFKYYHCEKMLFIVLARYISKQCIGKGKKTRIEKLLTEVFLSGREKTPEALKEVRGLLKAGIRPDQSLVDRYTEQFLIGKKCSFSIDQILEAINV